MTVDTEARHGALEMVQAKTFAPKAKPVMEVVGDNELVIVPAPEIKDHVPTPTVAVFAVITVVGEEMQSVCVVPAFEIVGISLTNNVTVETDAKQGELDIVHENTFAPMANPVIEVVGDNEFVIVPEPETKVQTPTPTVAVLAVITVVGEEIQSV